MTKSNIMEDRNGDYHENITGLLNKQSRKDNFVKVTNVQLVDSDRIISKITEMDTTPYGHGKRNLVERTRNTSPQTKIANTTSTTSHEATTILNQLHTVGGAAAIDILVSKTRRTLNKYIGLVKDNASVETRRTEWKTVTRKNTKEVSGY